MKRSPELFFPTSGERFMIFLSLADSEGSFNDFETHTAVVVGAFPPRSRKAFMPCRSYSVFSTSCPSLTTPASFPPHPLPR